MGWEQAQPTPEEIRQQCWKIQEGWSDKVKRERGAWSAEREEVEFPQVRAVDLPAAAEK